MEVLWNKNIDEIKDSGYLRKDMSITDALIDIFYNEILKKDEKEILKVAFSNDLKQEELDKLLKIWDIEVKGANKSLMLAYIMKLHPEMKFTEYEAPRLKGLLKFFRFQNMNIISHYVKIVRSLNAAGITPMILKGGAMKHLRPELPRIMGDIDILVQEKDFLKAVDVAVSLGYTYNKIDIHSVDIHKNDGSDYGILDIHKFIYMNTGYEKEFLKDLFKRARKDNVFGVESLVPSNEDMVFISLVNLARNMRDKTSQAGLVYSIFDCEYLQRKEGFDWEIVKLNAKKTHSEIQLNWAIKFIKRVSENIFPDIVQNNILFEKETQSYSNCVLYKRFYLEELRQKCRAMKIGKLFSGEFSVKDYLVLKTKYNLLKMIREHPLLIKLFIKDLKTRNYSFENL